MSVSGKKHLDQETDIINQFLDAETDKKKSVYVQKLMVWISFWIQKLKLWARGTISQVLSEGLRHGSLSLTTRYCTKPWRIPGDSFVIPKDMKVMIPIVSRI